MVLKAGQCQQLRGKQRSGDDLGGTVLMGVRLYNPTLGRFLQPDPVAGGSSNDYDYAGADPINNFDLDGRMCLGPSWTCNPWAAFTRHAKKAARSVYRHASFGGTFCWTICASAGFQNGDFSFGGGQLGFGGYGKFLGYNSATTKQQRWYNWGGCAALPVGGCVTMGRRSGKKKHNFWWGGGLPWEQECQWE